MTHADKSVSPPDSGRRRRRLLRLAASVLVLAALAGGGWWGWQKLSAPADPSRDLLTSTVQRGDIEDLVSAIGTLQPRDYVDVGAQVSGQLKKIHVEVGSIVKAGDLLAEIDPTLYVAKVDASRAQLRNLRAQMLDREAQLALAEINFKRQTNLKAADATTEEALQNANASLQSARAQIEVLKAQIEQTESSLRAEEANLNYARIYAPMAGTVVSITARQGQTLNTNQQAPTLLRIADLSTMTVQTQVSEADVSRLSLTMPAYFTTLGSQGRRWSGELKKIEPTPVVQNNVVLYNALFDVPNDNQSLMTQMTAQVFFVAASARDTLVVPMSAVTMAGRPQRGQRPEGAAGERGVPEAAGATGPANERGAGQRGAAGTTGSPGADAGVAGSGAPSATARAMATPTADSAERRGADRTAGERSAGGRPPGERPPGERRRGEDGRPEGTRQRGEPPGRAGATNGAGTTGATAAAPGVRQREAGAGPRSGEVWGAQMGSERLAQRPRRATVKVVAADGTISERQITIGVSNRVQAQVLSGLEEGERVVTGVRTAAPAQRANQPGQGLPGQGLPGGQPPGMFGGAPRGPR